MKRPKEEIPTKFWREYISSDIIGREEKLKNIVDHIDSLFNLKDKKLRKHTLKIGLMGYFDDLIDYMWDKKR